MQTRVAVVRCDDYQLGTVESALEEVLELLDIEIAQQGDAVIIKPNILSPAKPEEAVTTHPSLIAALVKKVKSLGGNPFVGDSPNLGGIRYTLRRTGIREAAETQGASILSFNQPQHFDLFPFFALDKQVLTANVLINACKLKSHSQLLITGAVKNLFGVVPGRRKPLLHLVLGGNESVFATMLLQIAQILKPRLNIVDAVVAMEGKGPKGGKPRHLGLIFAGSDPVAVDRVIAEVLALPLEKHFVLKAAMQHNIGCTDLSQIEVVGLPLSKIRIHDFQIPELMPINFSPLRILKGQIKHMILKTADSR